MYEMLLKLLLPKDISGYNAYYIRILKIYTFEILYKKGVYIQGIIIYEKIYF